jgi:hypothetical protein
MTPIRMRGRSPFPRAGLETPETERIEVPEPAPFELPAPEPAPAPASAPDVPAPVRVPG